MDFKIKIPEYVNAVLNNLEVCGFEAFVVGGCVRDCLMGKTPYDWDICTNATPEQTMAAFENKMPVIPTGIKHGTLTIVSGGKPIEVTVYRTDSGYDDCRHPSEVKFIKDISGDLSRRDFTVNAMAYNNKKGIIDLFDGQKDYNWHFDTIHGDNKMQVISKTWVETDNGGHWQYTTNPEIPSNHIPNDILSLSPYQSDTEITSFDLACSLGNYSVQTVYFLVLINLGENTRRFEYWLNTDSNNMIYVYQDNSGFVDYFAKGENNGDQRMAYIDVPPASVEYMTIMEVLPTGNAGGMNNRFVITSAN